MIDPVTNANLWHESMVWTLLLVAGFWVGWLLRGWSKDDNE